MIEEFGKGQEGKYVLVEESVTEICDKVEEPVCMLDMRAEK